MGAKVKALLLLAVMYGLGAVSGAAWQTYRSSQQPHGHNRSVYASHRIRKLKEQLHLSPAQAQALREIFQKAHDRAVEVNEEVSWDLADIHHDSVEAIRHVLTPEQTREFEKIHRRAHPRSPPSLPPEKPDAPENAVPENAAGANS